MQRWNLPPLAIVAGAGGAAIAALDPTPLAAFLAAGLVALGASWLLHRAMSARPAGPTSAASLPTVPTEAPFGAPAGSLGPGRALIEKLPVPLLIINARGRLIHANAAARQILHRLSTGQHFAQIIRAPAFVEAVNATLIDGRDRSFQFETFEEGDRRYEARVSMLSSGEIFGPEAQAIVQVEDRTQSHRSEMLRSDFIANASHELRTPLASIIGYIETLQNHARDDPEARERFLDIMAREAHRMQRLVDDLMSLGRIELSEHVRPVEKLSLNRIASDCASVFRPLAQQEGIDLSVELASDATEVIGDPDQLAQVFTNLIDNAMKYSGRGASIRIHPAPESPAHPGRIGISVSDTGIGIPKDRISRLTERFYRVNIPQSRNKGGTGLGLAIVKHILNRHRGRLEVASIPGKGSTFTVWLPIAEGSGSIHVLPQDRGTPDNGARQLPH
jgi:two-component system, OmpR family, phosphate regulon sensor histidine kinase PhoR